MLKVEQIKTLENGRGLVDTFGGCYHKEAEGIRNHESDILYKWRDIGPIMLDNLYII